MATTTPAATAQDVETDSSHSIILQKEEVRIPGHDLEKAATNPLERTSSTKSVHPLEQAVSQRPYGRMKWFLICFALYFSAFLYGLDNTIVADIQSATIATFGNISKLAWLGIGFPLGSIASILPVGKAFGSFDMKWMYVGSLIMFIAGSALCGAAPSMDALIVGRVWAGAGGAGMYLGVLNILSLNTTLHERPMYISLTGLTWGMGCILGPVIGGSLADSAATWRWAFYINLVIFGVFSPVYFWVLEPYNPDPQTSWLQKIKHVDWAGSVLYSAMYICFVMAFTFGGAQWPWSSGKIIALIVVFAALLVAFAIQQTFSLFTTQERRLFPIDFLKHRTLVILYVVMSAGAAGLFIPVFYIPPYFNFVHNDSNIDAALRLLPFICVTVFFILLNGWLMPRFGYYMPWYLVSGVFLLIGGALMYSLLDPSTSNAEVYGFSIIIAVGAGVSQQAAYSVAQAKVPLNRIADAVGFINSAQIGAVVIALTITGALFQNVGYRHVSDALEGLNFSSEEIHMALAGAKSSVFASISDEVRSKVVEGIVQAISDGYVVVFVAGAVTLIGAMLMKRERLFMEVSAGA